MNAVSIRLSGADRHTALADPPRGRPNTTLHVTGIALSFVAVGMWICTLVELLSTNDNTGALLISAMICTALGAALWMGTTAGSVRTRSIFAAVGWTWIIVTLIGALPYVLAGTFSPPGAEITLGEQIVNSIFESSSGFSCTGSTALLDFEYPGRGLMMYRQATQWYGGMGIVVLAVSVLPFLGVGGLDLITAEAPGPASDRLTPRVSQTARHLWVIYLIFTVSVGVVLFIIPGPSLYDSVAHALTTTSTGGFSPYSASIGHFDNQLVEVAIMAGMVYGGANFALHWRAARGEWRIYPRDSEFRAYLSMLVIAAVVVVGILAIDSGFTLGSSLRYGVFNVISLGTSTGFGNATGEISGGNYVLWAPAAQMVLLFLFVSGGSTGSTSGGIKVMRVQVLFAQAIRAIRRTQQPRAVLPIKHGAIAVAEDTVARMAGFFLIYALLVSSGVIILTALDGGLLESIGGIIGSLGNMGPSFGEAGPTASYSSAFTQPARLVLALFMVIGRLEIFPVLLMFAAPYRLANDAIRSRALR